MNKKIFHCGCVHDPKGKPSAARDRNAQAKGFYVCPIGRPAPAGAQPKKFPRPGARPNPAVQIYKPTRGVEIAGMQKPPGHPCDAKCKAADHKYKHRFKDSIEILGVEKGFVCGDGDVVLRRKV